MKSVLNVIFSKKQVLSFNKLAYLILKLLLLQNNI